MDSHRFPFHVANLPRVGFRDPPPGVANPWPHVGEGLWLPHPTTQTSGVQGDTWATGTPCHTLQDARKGLVRHATPDGLNLFCTAVHGL